MLALLIALLAPPPDAVAADPTPEPEVIEIRDRRARRDARDGTLAVDTLAPADDPRPLTGLGPLLDRAPGLRVVRSGDAGRGQTVQLRGAGGHQVGVLLDGVPLTAIRGVAVDLSTLPPALLDRVEVMRGAAGAAYGSGAQGGVLRLHTRAVRGPEADARLRGGSFGLLQGDGAVAYGGPAADGLLVVSGSRAAGDFDYADAQGRPATRLNNDHQRLGGLLRGRLRLGGVEASALAHGVWEERGEPGSDQRPDFDARTARDQALAALAVEGDAADGRLVWRGQGWWLRRRSTFDDPTGPVERVPARVDDRSAGARLSAEWHGFEGQRPSVAVEGHHAHAESRSPTEESGERRPGGAATVGWEVDAVEGLRVAPIVRLDARAGRDVMVVPKLGLAWAALDRPALRVTARANAGRLFRDPGFDELYVRGPGIRGDPSLRPEDGWGGDVGLTVRADVGPLRATLDGMLFAQRYDRLILFVPADAYTIEAQDDFAAAVDGAELALRLGWGPLRFEGTWLGQDARFTTAPRVALPDRPSHRLLGMLSATLGPVRPFALGRWHSTIPADRFGSRTRPGYGVLDAGLAAALPAGFSASAAVGNVLDVQAFDLLQRPLPRRSVVVEIGWSSR